MTDDETARSLIRRLDAVHAFISGGHLQFLRGIAEADRLEIWRQEGARDTAHWVAMRYGISQWKARRWVHAAHALEGLPALSAALASGRLGLDKAVELSRFATPDTEAELIRWARRVSCARIRRRGEEFEQRASDVVRAERERSVRGWFHDRGLHLEAELSATDGAVVMRGLDRLVERLPIMPGEEGASHIEARRADALVAMAKMTLAADPDPDRATVVVHLPHEALVSDRRGAEIEGGPVIHALAARRLLCSGRVQAVVEDARGRVLGVGRMTREPPPWLLRQVRHRDGGCTFPGCGTRAFTEAHHIVWWRAGGRTDLDNLALICSFHHKLVHELGWTIRRRPNGELEWSRPNGKVYRAGPSPPPDPASEHHALVAAGV